MTTIENKSSSDSVENKCLGIRVVDIMSKDIVSVTENDSIEDVIELFEKYHFHTYPVLNGNDDLVGVIDQNIILEILLFERLPLTKHTHMAAVRSLGEDAKSIMISHPVTVMSDFDLCDAADMMLKHQINRVCVVDDGKLMGMISKRDVIKEVNRIRGMG